jgi:hypothetical protein
MDFFDREYSASDEYFSTVEELEITYDESMYEEEEDEEEQEQDPDDPDYFDIEPAEEEDNDEDESEDENEYNPISVQSNPGFIRHVLQHGISILSNPTSSYEGATSSRRRRRRPPSLPYKVGKHLLYSGEFGEIDDRRAKKRRYEGARTLTQLARFRELGYRKESILAISKNWIPQDGKGRIVTHYDGHVYSGQFSHDGSFFYTASKDFKCRMYQTLNPGNARDWKLYKVLPQLSVLMVDCSSGDRSLDNYRCDIISR